IRSVFRVPARLRSKYNYDWIFNTAILCVSLFFLSAVSGKDPAGRTAGAGGDKEGAPPPRPRERAPPPEKKGKEKKPDPETPRRGVGVVGFLHAKGPP